MTYFEEAGKRMYDFSAKIFPYNRSLTGAGVRETVKSISEYISNPYEGAEGLTKPELKVMEIPSGTQVFDWTVPKEWAIREAYIEDEEHNRIVDFSVCNLHVLGYSVAVDEWVSLDELKEHIYTEPDQPEVIPYVTSYYKERYGFCMSQNQLDSLPNGRYHMYIDSELIDGSLTYAEVVIPGATDKELLFSTYFCHPSMANNECSGIALASELIRFVNAIKDRKYTYRFVFNPETIGAIAYLSQDNHVEYFKSHMEAGFVLSCVGDNYDYSIIESKYADTIADKALKNILKHRGKYSTYDFHERGSDERQYNAAGVDLPVVCYCRSKFGEFPEYHTSADDMNYVSPEGFQGSFEVITELIEAMEFNGHYMMKVLCEPQLGKRGLYSSISRKGSYDGIMVQRDVISYADGRNDLFDLSDRIGVPVGEIIDIIKRLMEHDLIEVLP